MTIAPGEAWLLTAAALVLSTAIPKILVDAIFGTDRVPSWPLYGLLYGTVALAFQHRIARLDLGRRDPVLLMAVTLLPLVSVLWSAAPAVSAQQGLIFLGTAVMAFALASIPPGEAMRCLVAGAIATPLLSLAAVALAPGIGLEQDGPWIGSWRGLQEQKNGLGAVSGFSLVLLFAEWRRPGGVAGGWIATGIAANLALLIGARSATAALICALAVVALQLPARAVRLVVLALPTMALAIVAAAVLIPELSGALLEVALALLGKDATLSNRLSIWQMLAPYIAERPWLGYGYNAFWAPEVLPAVGIEREIKFLPNSAHNGIVEMLLGLGVVGLALFGLLIAAAIANLVRHLDGARELWIARLAFALLIFAAGLNLSESWILLRNDRITVVLLWLCLVLAARRDVARTAPALPEPEPAVVPAIGPPPVRRRLSTR